MNVGKSIKVASAQREVDTRWLSEQLHVSITRINTLKSNTHCNTKLLERIAEAFEMTVSDFVALAE